MSSPSSHRLPVDLILPELRAALNEHATVLLRAEPGAGKTTRVPVALLDEPWLQGRRILMLEPRRLAAGNAARYMAEQLGSAVGELVGFRIRYQNRVSPRTRIEVVTEGILTRRLQADPELSGVGLVIFDEFHERNLQSDLALALCREVQTGLRDDLRLLIMSATLDAAPLLDVLGEIPLLDCPGRQHPICLHHASAPRSRDPLVALEKTVRQAVRETSGDILVFLPGAGEIRRLQGRLGLWADQQGLLLAPLFGGLDYAAQEMAIRPAGRRKLVLATNIAETSLTIDGVQTVVDSGLERRPRFDPAAGMTRLETVHISLASARQRAGRAGRLGPGDCYRLWSEAEEGALLPTTPAEIRNADLAPLLLELISWGVKDPGQLEWIDPPSETALEAARRLLLQLGAVDESVHLTPIGRRMTQFGCHPRLARLLVAAQDLGCALTGCALVALLGERDPFRGQQQGGMTGCDLSERLIAMQRPEANRRWPSLHKAFRFWCERCAASGRTFRVDAEPVAELLALAFPDRIAMRRQAGGRRYLLANGQGAVLESGSLATDAEWLVAVEMQGQSGEGKIRLASPLSEAQIRDLDSAVSDWVPDVRWDEQRQRVVAREVRRIGALVVQQRPCQPTGDEIRLALLGALHRRGLENLGWTPASRQLQARVNMVARVMPRFDWPDLSDPWLLDNLDVWLGPYLNGITGLDQACKVDLLPALRARLDFSLQRQLDRLAPVRIKVPSGREAALDYLAGDVPVLAVKLQELFGQQQTPCVADGRIPICIHLLSPAGRPLQVTSDLTSFWSQVYPEVRKEMQGRYPKHPWPENPLEAEATRRAKPRRR